MTGYEAARARFDHAAKNYPLAKAEAERIVREADEEYAAAWKNLRQHEASAGIARPEAFAG